MRRTVSTLLWVVCWTASATADEAPQDAALSRTAYSLLQADEELAEANLGVRVDRKGVAYLWGPAPSRAIVAKAEKALEGMPGVTAIINQCEITPATDTFLKEVSDALKGGTSPPALPDPAATAQPTLAPPPPPVFLPLAEREAVTVLKPPVELIPTGSGPATAEPTARLLNPEAMPSRDPDYRAIARLRSSDRRYADLRLELRDGRIVVSGHAADAATAWELARRLAPLAGSRDIVVGRVTRRD